MLCPPAIHQSRVLAKGTGWGGGGGGGGGQQLVPQKIFLCETDSTMQCTCM